MPSTLKVETSGWRENRDSSATALKDTALMVAADGVHDLAEMAFSIPWTDAPPEERGRAPSSTCWARSPVAAGGASLAVLYAKAVIGRKALLRD
ncbi:hypothetical protein SANTM175S_10847 [Streptomyces antimycoticus]